MGLDPKKRQKFKAPSDGDWFQGYASAAIDAGDIVRVVSTTPGGAYFNLTPALGDGSQSGKLGIAVTKAAVAGRQVWFKWFDSLEMDTSTGALGDVVYVSSSSAGELTLSLTGEVVGWVTEVGTSGRVFVDPPAAKGASSAGGVEVTVVSASPATLTNSTSEQVILVDVSPCTINMPAVATGAAPVTVKDRTGSASGGTPITINAAGGETIDGESTKQISVGYGSVTLVPNGTEWSII
jgi:hypothetical protein